MKANIYFFCDNPLADEKNLKKKQKTKQKNKKTKKKKKKKKKRESATRKIGTRVRECAHILQDTAVLAKLSAGDLVALEAKYHATLLRTTKLNAKRNQLIILQILRNMNAYATL